MPNRIIRDAILASESVCSLDWPEEVFYRRLMSIVDDYGRCEANLQLLRSRCYPLQTDRVRVADISRWMAACLKTGVILYYEVSGKGYLEIQKFGQQQRSASKCPSPPSLDDVSNPLKSIDSKFEQAKSIAQVDVDVDVVEVVVEEKLTPRNAAPIPLEVTSKEMQEKGISEDLAVEYLRYRKKKKSPLTPRAWSGILKEIDKAGISIEDCLEKAMSRGWVGFESDWMQGKNGAEPDYSAVR
jgi:hypothetical protein